LATCFSNAVGFEMAQQLKKEGEAIALLAMVDASPGMSYTVDNAEANSNILGKLKQTVKQSAIRKTGAKAFRTIKTVLQTNKTELSEQEKNLLKVQQKLDHIFYIYERKPYDGKITLIRSSEFSNRTDKDFHLDGWKDLLDEKNFEVLVVPGSHQTLFIEPEVQELANTLNKCLIARKK